MTQMIARDISEHITSKPLNASPLSTSASRPRKFRMKLPGVRQAGPPVDPSELRVQAVTCVKLVNLDILVDRLREIMERIPPVKLKTSDSALDDIKALPPPPPKGTDEGTDAGGRPLPPLPPRRRQGPSSPTSIVSDAPRMPARITVISAHNLSTTRPFTTLISVRVSSILPPTSPTSSTDVIPSPSTTSSNHTRDILRTSQKTSTAHHHMGYYVVAMGNVGLGDVDVPLGGGRVKLRIEADWEGTRRTVEGRVGYVVETALEDAVDKMVDKTFVARMWGRVLSVCFSLVLPTLGEGEGVDGEVQVEVGLGLKEKRVWDDMRVDFLKWAVEILKSFLHSDGDGLPMDFLETPTYRSLISTFEHYDLSKRDAISLHQRTFGIGERNSDPDDAWLLRLIRLKKGHDYVESVLFARATGQRL
ncbi:hypothetical protein BC829DRAFT_380610 [Chytridium lagenaria]|nr:hypothetical protein BC829DRAFT_380610 [Chytridium lagenaria]